MATATPQRESEKRIDGLNGGNVHSGLAAFGSVELAAIRALISDQIAAGDPEECGRLILQLNGRDAVYESRLQADRCLRHFPNNARLSLIKRLVDPPGKAHTATVERIDRRPDLAWLNAHALEYPGEWLILSRGILWAHSPDLDDATKKAEAAGLNERPLVYHVWQS